MKRIGWGMIGCGDVTRVKSGPAFNKVNSSFIAAVMSRDLDKAKHYAKENNILHYYSDATLLLADPDVNAVYVATPPSTHEVYAMMAIAAGKDVYIEKPMALNSKSAAMIMHAAKAAGVKVVVAHYRREQPIFKKVKELINTGAIGKIRSANCRYQKLPQSEQDLQIPGNKWRVDPSISGGGIFHDLAPHQIDLMLYFFGGFKSAHGFSQNQMNLYKADDIVAGNVLFDNDIIFTGNWLFNGGQYVDEIEITGTNGRISFAAFQHELLTLETHDIKETYTFEKLPHVQMPLINETVKYFLDRAPNPCDPQAGVDVMRIIDAFTSNA